MIIINMAKTFFAKGKRGIIYTANYRGKKVAIKEPNPCAEIKTISNEAFFLPILNKLDIGPKFISFKKNTLVREFVDGVPIVDYLKNSSSRKCLQVIKRILNQCRKMDLAGINKFELTNPHKDILVAEEKPVLIDFERCKQTEKTKNVTQFCQFLMRQNTLDILVPKGININKSDLQDLCKSYKNSYDSKAFQAILRSL